MYILKFFIDYTKEEKWLNEMANKGYELINNNCGYKFNKTSPKDITYRIDYRNFKNNQDFIDYCTMFEDSGWRHVSGSKSSGNQYFKKMANNSDDDIFSDSTSKAARYKRVSNIWLTMSTSYFTILLTLSLTGAVSLQGFLNPKSLYYTPGLWNETGFTFLRKFLFETPFALSRGFLWIVFPIGIAFYLYFMFKASKLYKQTLKERSI